eukprot:TRINITY_DN8145_c0_g6_i1.p1 TRINITY_DN8145_c0_g6~~TRINITY_DN8145_c0_g6_i1.p1  ORF type:complete len:454 (-),score=92.19 TRINITY_DN8145_c0_g6_i1:75-1250(-)
MTIRLAQTDGHTQGTTDDKKTRPGQRQRQSHTELCTESGDEEDEEAQSEDLSRDVADMEPVTLLSSIEGLAAVLEKPAGVTTEALISRFEADRRKAAKENAEKAPSYSIRSVSRLDAPTSGSIMVPLSEDAEAILKDCFASQKVQKAYLALVLGDTPSNGIIDVKLRAVQTVDRYRAVPHPSGKPATTVYRRLGLFQSEAEQSQYSLLMVWPKTGRMHQIRAHMAHIGFPLAGDVRYAPRKGATAWLGERLFLHAAYVSVMVRDCSNNNSSSNNNDSNNSRSSWSLSAVSALPGNLREPLKSLGANVELFRKLESDQFYQDDVTGGATDNNNGNGNDNSNNNDSNKGNANNSNNSNNNNSNNNSNTNENGDSTLLNDDGKELHRPSTCVSQ